MKRSVLWIGVACAAIAVGVGLAVVTNALMGFSRPEVMFLASAGLLVLLMCARSMNDQDYGRPGGPVDQGLDGRQRQSRDIGHLPGRSHRTFVGRIGHGIAASVGNMQQLRHARAVRLMV